MRAFVRVVDEGGFAAAARALEIDQAVVTRQIADLERYLGVKLLERTTRSMRVTEAGLTYLARCRDILSEIAEAEATVSRSHHDMVGRVRMALPTIFSKAVAAEQLSRLRLAFPNLTVEMTMFDRPVDPVAEGFDVVITNANHHVSALAVARPLLDMPLILCAAPSYLQRCGEPTAPEKLAQHDCVSQVSAQESGHAQERWSFEDAKRKTQGVDVRISLRANSYDLSLEAVRCGMGVGRLPHHLIAEDLDANRLNRLLPSWKAGAIRYNLVYPGRRMMPRRVRHVIDTIVAQRNEAAPPEK